MKVCVITFKDKGKDYVEPYVIECPENEKLDEAKAMYMAILQSIEHGKMIFSRYAGNYISDKMLDNAKHSTVEMRKLLGNPPKGIKPIVVSIDFRHTIPQEDNE